MFYWMLFLSLLLLWFGLVAGGSLGNGLAFSLLVELNNVILPAALIASTVALNFCFAVKFFLIFSATSNFLLKSSLMSVEIHGWFKASFTFILFSGSTVNNLLIKFLAESEITSHSGEKYSKLALTTLLNISASESPPNGG